ncbi:MAG TPA: TIGR02281 family clan AA aspartic protease [Sphingomicrobium sp.]|nr:TIGR02281 family clan AA aspartic protease [Sphingomicrobium sp.]
MTNDLMLGGVYLVMALMLVLSSLMVRREPVARLATYALAWVAIFAAGFILFTFRDNLDWVWQRVRAEATGEPVHVGKELRIPMAIDGHFWVDARINGTKVKFLVDSGATMTTIDRRTARSAGVEVSPVANQIVRTGNGLVRVASGRAEELKVGTIVRHDFALHVAANDDLNVLGMNFLSTLDRWGVEGRWLVLVP